MQVRVDEGLRSEANGVLREIGLNVPSAVWLFLTKVVQTRSIPFELTAPARVVGVGVGAATQANTDEVGAFWSKRKSQRA